MWQWPETVERAVERYDLAKEIAEIDSNGYTIVPPEKTLFSPAKVARAKEVLIAEMTRRTGVRWDEKKIALDAFEPGSHPPAYAYVTRMFESDQVFLDFQTNPVLNTLHRHIIGDRFRMRTANGMFKWANEDGWGPNHGLHTDTQGLEFAKGRYYIANVNWLLNDVEADDGPICFLPGSHTFDGLPGPDTITDELRAQIRPIEAPAGSFVVFNSHVWHGSWPRKRPGLRLTTHTMRGAPGLPLWDFSDTSEDVIARSREPGLFRMLCGTPPMRGDNPGFLPRIKARSATNAI
ncbi:MAG: phytanoyl-CoA dioxygenase family protein [Pseudomonadota bacterium]